MDKIFDEMRAAVHKLDDSQDPSTGVLVAGVLTIVQQLMRDVHSIAESLKRMEHR